MTIDEYATDYGGLEESLGPPRDPEEQAMIDHLLEFEVQMFRLQANIRLNSCSAKELREQMMDLHGEHWQDAL